MTITVNQILRSDEARLDEPKTPLMISLDALRGISAVLALSFESVRSDERGAYEDWKLIYESVFSSDPRSISERVQKALEIAGTSFPDYRDPDTSHKEDVRAWFEALSEKLLELEYQHLDSIAEWVEPDTEA